MNSKLLIKQNRELFDKLQIANLNCRRLTEENVALKEKIQFLTEQLANKKEEAVIKAEEAVVTDEVVTETVEREAVELSPEIEYGSNE